MSWFFFPSCCEQRPRLCCSFFHLDDVCHFFFLSWNDSGTDLVSGTVVQSLLNLFKWFSQTSQDGSLWKTNHLHFISRIPKQNHTFLSLFSQRNSKAFLVVFLQNLFAVRRSVMLQKPTTSHLLVENDPSNQSGQRATQQGSPAAPRRGRHNARPRGRRGRSLQPTGRGGERAGRSTRRGGRAGRS